MVESNTKKRMLPSELANRFSSKDDFSRYFGTQSKCNSLTLIFFTEQFLVLPPTMFTKDFIKAYFAGDKDLLPLSACKMVSVPHYDELSVKRLWPHCQKMPEIMRFFPDSLPKGRLPDRNYFWTILNTLNPEYVRQLIDHAVAARNAAGEAHDEEETIVVTAQIAEVLKDAPMISRKFPSQLTLL